jgi:SAM-dependent methyltransferase
MISDGTVLDRALYRISCNECGYGFHRDALEASDIAGFYSDGYDLGLRNRSAEMSRANDYADQIIDFLGGQDVNSLIEFGCGTGSLLSILKDRLKLGHAVGVEPSPQLAETAKAENEARLTICRAFAEDYQVEPPRSFDICLSVNVAEHSLSPEDFLHACRNAIRPGGSVLVICPDGETPISELLFFDHVSSFTGEALAAFAERAQLSLVNSKALTGNLSGFRIHLLKDRVEARSRIPDNSCLTSKRIEFLHNWASLESSLSSMLAPGNYAVFGVGEFADLLAAYAPSLIDGASYFVIDIPGSETYNGKPIVATETFVSDSSSGLLLAAVNERAWPQVQERLLLRNIEIIHPNDTFSGRAEQ